MTKTDTIGLLPVGRATFDVPYARQKLDAMLNSLDATGYTFVGPRELLFDSESALSAIDEFKHSGIDQLLVLQVTFTDAAIARIAASKLQVPLSIWAVPEPRQGARLRLNAFCGLNLTSHALGLDNKSFGWLYQEADEHGTDAIKQLLSGKRPNGDITAASSARFDSVEGQRLVTGLRGKRIGCIGDHPDGFATCAYDKKAVHELTGINVEKIPLNTLFDTARQADPVATDELSASTSRALSNLDDVNPDELNRSLRLKVALDSIRSEQNFDAFAIRCWPETFTEYGGAVCGPVSILGEARVPCACEADVYGAMTQLLLQDVADAPVFLVDLVDIDVNDDSSVVWHCGQAPLSMADPDSQPVATIHTNRKMPLLYEFPLKPGRVTFARLSQAKGVTKLIIAGGDMLKRDMAFTGTSGVVRFDSGAATFLDSVIAAGLEHHLGLVYGDHRNSLRAVAAALEIPIVEL